MTQPSLATRPSAAFLLLVDSRLPTGGHAHSGGMEEAVARGVVGGGGGGGGATTRGRVRSEEGVVGLERWLRGRLHTVGVVDAAFAAAAFGLADHLARYGSSGHPYRATFPAGWVELHAEWAARTVSLAVRDAGRAQGRGLLRAAAACWPSPQLDGIKVALPAGAPWPVALGAAGWSAGCRLEEITSAAASAAVSGPAWTATRLLGADPFAVAAIVAGLGLPIAEVARDAEVCADPGRPWSALPAFSAPLLDLGAEHHASWEVRLFAS